MKKILRIYITSCLSFYLVTYLVEGINFSGGVETFLLIGAVLTVMNIFLKPILKIFMVPFNLVSLGLFSWLLNAVILFLLTKVISQVKITGFRFEGLSYGGFVIPAVYLGFWETLLAGTVIMSLVNFIIYWLVDD